VTHPSPGALMRATLSHKGRGKKQRHPFPSPLVGEGACLSIGEGRRMRGIHPQHASPWAGLIRPSNVLFTGTKLDGRVEPGHGVMGTGYPPCLSTSAPWHPGGMTTPILTAAAARKTRRNPRPIHRAGVGGRGKNIPDNYLAQAPKKQAGAPLGNTNAVRGGIETRDRHARLNALVRQLCASADAVMAACDQAARERSLLAAMLERRDG